MKFLMIEGGLLRNKNFSPASKLVISYLFNLGKSGKCYFGNYQYLADVLGIEYDFFSKCIAGLLAEGMIVQTSDGLTLGRDMNFYSNFSRELDVYEKVNSFVTQAVVK